MFSCILVLWSIFKQTFDLPFFRLSITFRYKWLFQCLQMVIFGFCRGTMALILWLTTGCLSCQWCKESPEIKAMLKCLKWICSSEKKEQSNVWLFLKKSTKKWSSVSLSSCATFIYSLWHLLAYVWSDESPQFGVIYRAPSMALKLLNTQHRIKIEHTFFFPLCVVTWWRLFLTAAITGKYRWTLLSCLPHSGSCMGHGRDSNNNIREVHSL